MVALPQLLESVAGWVQTRSDVVGLALFGSHARGTAGPASDVDFVILTTRPNDYRTESEWVAEIRWPSADGPLTAWRDADYGMVWSRHLHFADGTEVELSFAAPHWARTAPVDPGTQQVIRAGCQILWDPQAMLRHLVAAVKSGA